MVQSFCDFFKSTRKNDSIHIHVQPPKNNPNQEKDTLFDSLKKYKSLFHIIIKEKKNIELSIKHKTLVWGHCFTKLINVLENNFLSLYDDNDSTVTITLTFKKSGYSLKIKTTKKSVFEFIIKTLRDVRNEIKTKCKFQIGFCCITDYINVDPIYFTSKDFYSYFTTKFAIHSSYNLINIESIVIITNFQPKNYNSSKIKIHYQPTKSNNKGDHCHSYYKINIPKPKPIIYYTSFYGSEFD